MEMSFYDRPLLRNEPETHAEKMERKRRRNEMIGDTIRAAQAEFRLNSDRLSYSTGRALRSLGYPVRPEIIDRETVAEKLRRQR